VRDDAFIIIREKLETEFAVKCRSLGTVFHSDHANYARAFGEAHGLHLALSILTKTEEEWNR